MRSAHEETFSTPPPRRSSWSRSRVRDLPPGEDEGNAPHEGEGDGHLGGARRKGRGREVSYDLEDAEALVKEMRGDGENPRTTCRRRTASLATHLDRRFSTASPV